MPGKNINVNYERKPDHYYNMGEYTKANIGKNDLMVYMCYDDSKTDTVAGKTPETNINIIDKFNF